MAGRLFINLSSVCLKWRQSSFENFRLCLGFVDVDFCTLPLQQPGEIDKDCTNWMCFHNLRLGALKFNARGRENVDQMLRVIQACDTANTRVVNAQVFWHGSAQVPAHVQKVLHDVIAENCPALEEFSSNFVEYMKGNRICSSHLSKTMFSHPSVRVVDLTVELSKKTSWYGPSSYPTRGIFERLSCNLEALERLKLAYKATPSAWLSPRHYGCFAIKSNSLKFLDVVGLAGGMWIQCHCPQLESFRCKGGDEEEGNGSLPNLNRQQFDTVKAGFSQIESVTANLKFLEVPFVGLTIPRSCECTVISFSNRISAATSYDFDYRRHIDFLQNYDLQDEI